MGNRRKRKKYKKCVNITLFFKIRFDIMEKKSEESGGLLNL